MLERAVSGDGGMLAGLYGTAGGMEGASDRSDGWSAGSITEEASLMELYREERYGPDVRDRGKLEIGSLDFILEHGGTVVSGSEWMDSTWHEMDLAFCSRRGAGSEPDRIRRGTG